MPETVLKFGNADRVCRAWKLTNRMDPGCSGAESQRCPPGPLVARWKVTEEGSEKQLFFKRSDNLTGGLAMS